eukprot:SAG31_NODE_2735_length_5170_cov_5.478407_2_plen_50_part_00
MPGTDESIGLQRVSVILHRGGALLADEYAVIEELHQIADAGVATSILDV